MTGPLPNAILAGVQKGGTTALFDWLSQHPEVFADPTMKDFPFYCREGYWNKGLEWFSKCFSAWEGEPIILHGYVNYLSLASESAELIYDTNPKTKVFAVLRNPPERAYSAYLQARKMGRESATTFGEALDNEWRNTSKDFTSRMDHSYLNHGFYTDCIRQYLNIFGPDQARFFLFEELNDNPLLLFAELCSFLGIATDFQPTLGRRNDYAVPRSRTLQRIINRGMPVSFLRELVPMNYRIKIRRFFHRTNLRPATKPAIDPDLVAQLKEAYRDEIDSLEELLGKDLSAWREWRG